MYDYWRLLIVDRQQIQTILNNPLFDFKQKFEKTTAELHEFPQEAKYKNWEIEAFSPTHLLIKGSIHKFYNGGTNETDFTISDAVKAIETFCNLFKLDPALARVTNLEFAVNVCPAQCASDIIDQIICFKNTRPTRPYESRKDYYFIEFDIGDYYVKVYDKGKQYKGANMLRFEVKGVKNRYFDFAGITTLKDLTVQKTMQLLGVKINEVFKDVVFNDDTIELSNLSTADKKNYLLMKDANEWAKYKKKKTSTHRCRENRFRAIVREHGKRKTQENLATLINNKTTELTNKRSLAVFTSKYTMKTNNYHITNTALIAP